MRQSGSSRCAADPDGTGTGAATATEPDASAHRAASRQRWATLLKRVFQTDALVCPTCQGPRRILAAITEHEPIHKILTCLGLSTDVPVVAKARPPPRLTSRLTNRAERPERADTFDPPDAPTAPAFQWDDSKQSSRLYGPPTMNDIPAWREISPSVPTVNATS